MPDGIKIRGITVQQFVFGVAYFPIFITSLSVIIL